MPLVEWRRRHQLAVPSLAGAAVLGHPVGERAATNSELLDHQRDQLAGLPEQSARGILDSFVKLAPCLHRRSPIR
jgi:hypothetical protein